MLPEEVLLASQVDHPLGPHLDSQQLVVDQRSPRSRARGLLLWRAWTTPVFLLFPMGFVLVLVRPMAAVSVASSSALEVEITYFWSISSSISNHFLARSAQ